MAPKVSIIIPVIPASVSRAEVLRTLDTVKAQNFKQFETWVIWDSPEEKIPEIIWNYADSDERFHMDGCRESAGEWHRLCNRGLELAQGEFVFFCMPGDLIPEDAVQRLFRAAREKLADLVIGKYILRDGTEAGITGASARLTENLRIDKSDIALCGDTRLCNKLLRRSVIERDPLRIRNSGAGAEALFIAEYIQHCRTMTGCPAVVCEHVKSSGAPGKDSWKESPKPENDIDSAEKEIPSEMSESVDSEENRDSNGSDILAVRDLNNRNNRSDQNRPNTVIGKKDALGRAAECAASADAAEAVNGASGFGRRTARAYRQLLRNFEAMVSIADDVLGSQYAAVKQKDAPQAEKDEAYTKWRQFRSAMYRSLMQAMLEDYYRLLWISEPALFPLLEQTYQMCRENMFPGDWAALEQAHPDLRLDAGLMNRKELAENPLLSVLVTPAFPVDKLHTLLTAYYRQHFAAFEIQIDEKLAEQADAEYRDCENFHTVPHDSLTAWKRQALKESKGKHCIIIEEPIYPSAHILVRMMDAIGSALFITAPLARIAKTGNTGNTYAISDAHRTVFTNELTRVKKYSIYNKLDWMWGNKIFDRGRMQPKKRLFDGQTAEAMFRMYRNLDYVKFQEGAFLTDLSEEDILRNSGSMHARLGYRSRLRKEERRVRRLEKESTPVITAAQNRWEHRKRFLRNVYKFGTLRILLPLVYHWHARKPVQENKVLFIINRKAELPNSMTVIHNALDKSGKYVIHEAYLHEKTLRYRQQLRGDIRMIRDLATARCAFVDDATETLGGFRKRRGTAVVQLWHACGAFKKFGFSTADKIFGENAKMQLRYPTYHNLDLVCVSSPEVVWAYEEAMRLQGQGTVKPVGVSRTDVFFDPDYVAAAKQRVISRIPAASDKKIILYAPTFRGRVSEAEGPDNLDFGEMADVLGEEYILLIKHHPYVRNLPEIPVEYRDTFAYDVSQSMEIEDLLCAADICISDYSSIIFEYSLFDRPILLFAYDLDVYFDWRGFYYDYDEMAPGPVVISTEEIIDYILHVDERFDREKMRAFREKFMQSCDGHATERILREVGLEG